MCNLDADRPLLPAPRFADILSRAPAFGTRDNPLGERLVSVVFAHPGSHVWRELETNRGFLDTRSGAAWDLFFAGLSAYAPMPHEAEPFALGRSGQGRPRLFNPKSFTRIADRIAREHAAALAANGTREPWRYSGGTDLVSFMCYAREPDWLSLKSVRLYPWSRLGPGTSLSEVTEGLRRWKAGTIAPELAPGEAPAALTVPFDCLADALAWSAAAVAGGLLGNAAYDLLKQLTT